MSFCKEVVVQKDIFVTKEYEVFFMLVFMC